MERDMADDDKVIKLEVVEERREESFFKKTYKMEQHLTTTLISLIRVYQDDPHWLEDVGVHALIEALVMCAGSEGMSGMSLLKRLAFHMQAAAADDANIWPQEFARWFIKGVPRELTEYEDIKWFGHDEPKGA
jgi:hypothetical protein